MEPRQQRSPWERKWVEQQQQQKRRQAARTYVCQWIRENVTSQTPIATFKEKLTRHQSYILNEQIKRLTIKQKELGMELTDLREELAQLKAADGWYDRMMEWSMTTATELPFPETCSDGKRLRSLCRRLKNVIERTGSLESEMRNLFEKQNVTLVACSVFNMDGLSTISRNDWYHLARRVSEAHFAAPVSPLPSTNPPVSPSPMEKTTPARRQVHHLTNKNYEDIYPHRSAPGYTAHLPPGEVVSRTIQQPAAVRSVPWQGPVQPRVTVQSVTRDAENAYVVKQSVTGRVGRSYVLTDASRQTTSDSEFSAESQRGKIYTEQVRAARQHGPDPVALPVPQKTGSSWVRFPWQRGPKESRGLC
ncbi:MAG: uncharacterized protein KVP18_003735 [Porospora cf. gigantea A]|uniref:uncharacterized protein n=1 Tax=Porospora cf. gigantea A TaxID=2853593 RepID=UPI00355A7182|nr:MAG: hypothetical protein KVP18_003735 [Porospora cf. gigantea A]